MYNYRLYRYVPVAPGIKTQINHSLRVYRSLDLYFVYKGKPESTTYNVQAFQTPKKNRMSYTFPSY